MNIVLLATLTSNYTFISINPQTNNVFIVDPSESDEVLNFTKTKNLNITYILNTHHHSDHIGGNNKIKSATKCKIIAPKYDQHRIPNVDFFMVDGYLGEINGYKYRVIYIPGHTLGHVAYYFEEENILFCGDALFSGGCGRIFEGTPKQMYQSLYKLIQIIKLDTKIYCAHEYTLNNLKFALELEPKNKELNLYYNKVRSLRANNQPTIPTTLKLELAINPFLRTYSQEIQASLNLSEADELEVFTKIRALKDRF